MKISILNVELNDIIHGESLNHFIILIFLTDGCVMISVSFAKQLKTDNATDWNISLGHASGLSLLRSIRARNWNPIPYNRLKNIMKISFEESILTSFTNILWNKLHLLWISLPS